jgi:hypothetical protein
MKKKKKNSCFILAFQIENGPILKKKCKLTFTLLKFEKYIYIRGGRKD